METLDFSAIGAKIKELRKTQRLSQKELADGICTQAQISKLENGDVYPYASTLYFIAEKLGVDVNYFLHIGTTPRLDYVEEVSRQLKLARRVFKYSDIKQIVKAEENNPLFTQNPVYLQLLLWHKGIYEYYLHKDMEGSLEWFDKAIELTQGKNWSEREIEISISKGIILFEENHLNEAMELYEKAEEYLNMLPILKDETIKIRLHYNMARTWTRMGVLSKSVSSCHSGIDYCLDCDNLFLLGELHYHLGYNFELQEDFKKARDYMERALIIFELQKDNKYDEFIRGKLQSWDS
ncbi:MULTISPECIES: helix-turn-helix domain-containing protein [Bacillus]|uniref:helix-turn-helix domain-containing protein n=1 Tax=Bacillus TaxID=1386 RepID=UPI0020A0C9BC|nr:MULTISPECIES: helix-turn-helix domain-containing protein [Bacillus]MCP1160547.1 helix-turn-helix transcriptional regulator [Bacillus infantis]